ncbi:MAG TPA: proline--tRNA ligase [Arenicellales bacterium]|jgi:prolyl-tRNA synthetase|nr:proline--tRNA ligase [Arenicellales bacterium]HCF73368.1 proline--tRNA ligase [Gammaproteobacteria bacterium]HJP10779.1 proline--tRNA ligase [Arenicellales bacterium]|tara:strand:- start:6961 stop:8673 length:1713 start_codon:yes stop_codon:yes gene_type:complete
MRTSQFLIATLRETPADAEIISHQLMLRAGLIRQVAAGIYNWLPLGHRVLRKIETVVREEMNRSGGQEVLLPAVQPAELWRESGRWDDYGPELLRLTDRHHREFCFGPTHEEVVTTLARSEIRSYRQLPINLYQIQTKFRDEIRPRFGVMRAREFIMKDAYTFDIDEHGMGNSYEVMYQAYERIFQRLGLEARAVEADSGTIGGSFSHEFHVLADTGEDAIALCPEAGYSANVEKVTLSKPAQARPEPGPEMVEIETPGQHTIEDLCRFLSLSPQRTVKTLIVKGQDEGLVALVLRGDHELNSVKAEALPEVAKPIRLASASDIRQATGADPGSIGPVGIKITVIADHSAIGLADFVCGANRDERHLSNVNWGRDLPEPRSSDLRQAVDGDPCPVDPTRPIQVRRGIEVGHVFQLGTKYSEALGANYLDSEGQARAMYMGCYGIGVTRIVAAAIEQNHDEHGIIWPDPIAPFDVCIVPISMHKSSLVAETVERLARELSETGFEVLVDDRNERPGVMFSEMDLIGIPHRLVVGERGLKAGTVEYRNRRSGDTSDHPVEELVQVLSEMRQI